MVYARAKCYYNSREFIITSQVENLPVVSLSEVAGVCVLDGCFC